MNILFTNDEPFHPQYGGIERGTDTLTRQLILADHKVFYCSFYCDKPDLLHFPYPATLLTLPCPTISDAQNIHAYQSFLQSNHIELIINQRGLLESANFFIQFALPSIRIISVFHSKPFGYYSTLSKSFFLPRSGVKGRIIWLGKILFAPLLLTLFRRYEFLKAKKQLEYAINHSHKAVFLSDSYTHIVSKYCKIDTQKLTVIPNANTYSNVSTEMNKTNTILFVGRLTAWDKRPILLLKAWELIADKNPSWELIFVGHGAELPYLQKYINRKHVPRVKLEGKQDPKSYYEKASVFGLTSSYEGFPMALTEAMQHAVVPIVMNTFCAEEIISHLKDGIIVTSERVSDYANELQRLINHPNLPQMGQLAQQHVERFNIHHLLSQWQQLIQPL